MEGGSDEAADDSFWCRRFRFGGLRVAIEEEFGAGLGGTVWGGAVALARHLSEAGGAVAAADELADAAPLVAIELGAGCCGLPSLVVAHCGRYARVIATDWCVQLLRRGLLLLPVYPHAGTSQAARCCHGSAKTSWPTQLVQVARLRWACLHLHTTTTPHFVTHPQVLELNWSDTAGLAALPRAHLLLAADVAYGMSDDLGERGAEAAEVLANALSVLAAPRAVVLLAQLVRAAWLPCAESQN